MSNDMVRELFRSFENTLYERLRIIEDILSKQRQEGTNPHMAGVEKNLHAVTEHMKTVEFTTLKRIEELNVRFDNWLKSMDSLQQQINGLRDELQNSKRVDDRPVELVQAQLEQSSSLDKDVNATVVERNAKSALARAVQALPSVQQVEEEEEEVEEEEIVEEEVEEEEVEEEEDLGLTEFEYKGKTYYHDSEYKVYKPDADGAIGDPIGLYDPQTNRIRRI